MGQNLNSPSGEVVGLIDLGTNSVRLMVVRINPNRSYTIINQHKVMVRLGEGEFAKGVLCREAMERTILVLKRFVEMSVHLGASDFWAVATAATRDAENKRYFINKVREETGLDLKVISGLEEARLTYLGVASGFHLGDRKAIFMDIGGGSTEIVVGNQLEFFSLDSMKLGAVRLKNMFFLDDDEGPVSPGRYAILQHYVANSALRSIQRISDCGSGLAFGSSGTIETLYEITRHNNIPGGRNDIKEGEEVLSMKELENTVKMLCSLNLRERKKISGMNPRRADIIIPGAAILHTLMRKMKLAEIQISRRSLRHGLLHDYLMRGRYGYLKEEPRVSVREQSVLQLGRSCGFDELHARHVADLARQLFESGRDVGIHILGDGEKELLWYASMLHDVGMFLSFSNHHSHSYYLISNAELLGFYARETAIMAGTAFYHSKKYPKKRHPEFASLDPDAKETVKVLSMLLSIAESLDRTHHQLTRKARFSRRGKRLILDVEAMEGNEIELWALETRRKNFRKTFGENFEVESKTMNEQKGLDLDIDAV